MILYCFYIFFCKQAFSNPPKTLLHGLTMWQGCERLQRRPLATTAGPLRTRRVRTGGPKGGTSPSHCKQFGGPILFA